MGQSEDWLALQMALAPCLIGYGAIARRLYSEDRTLRDGNQYWKWIENYVAEDYTEAVRLGSGKLLSPIWIIEVLSNSICHRTARRAYAADIAQSDGGVDPDLHPGNRVGDSVLGHGVE